MTAVARYSAAQWPKHKLTTNVRKLKYEEKIGWLLPVTAQPGSKIGLVCTYTMCTNWHFCALALHTMSYRFTKTIKDKLY